MRNCFVEGTMLQWAWDSTSLGEFKLCPRKYQYKILEGWRGKTENIHLRFGLEVHEALADYAVCRVDGIEHEEAVFHVVRALLDRLEDYPDENSVVTMAGNAKRKTKEALIDAVIGYLDHYNPDTASTIILENGAPAVEVSFKFEFKDQFMLCGHLDNIVNYQGSKYIRDRKTTTSALTGWYYDQFDPDNQMSLYTIAGQVVVGSPVRGVIIDAIAIDGNGYPSFGRGFTYRDQDRLEEWLGDLNYYLEQAKRYAEANYWPMNDTSCGKYGGCQFRGVCSKAPKVREAYLQADFTQMPENERWNPLQVRSTSTTPSLNESSGSSMLEQSVD